ncbi:cardiac-enriched FHL2-interacting protein [Tachyglossus aculeatus]|uniref:cardiac-enriched FHL2-interacting protein n=1 Tax=Tachyglossus aculeatus TaxID=9261 RepID=UPI0018F3312E|nr:cardiac-enriched FHL2-interacting protein [Tachyglossus aculeatus]
MQGNKKCSDGLSDSSSIGSVLDDADREVSSLTDRAFRSLCIAEEASFNDSNLVISPDISRQFFGKFHQGTGSHVLKKSNLYNRLPPQRNERATWASTFQQLPKYVQGEERYPKGSTPPLPPPARKALEVPVSGLRSSKPVSKVSSLIKTFDRTESQRPDNPSPAPKQAAQRSSPKCTLRPGSGVNFCFDSAFLKVRKVPAEPSDPSQTKHWPGSKQVPEDSSEHSDLAYDCDGLSPERPDPTDSFQASLGHPPQKPSRGKTVKSKEQASQGSFLHSENSAFESWNTHSQKMLERQEVTEIPPETKVALHYEDMPLFREPHTSEYKTSPSHTRAALNQEESIQREIAPCSSGSQVTSDPSASEFPGFARKEKPSHSEPDSEMVSTQPPWRRPRNGRKGKETRREGTNEMKINGQCPCLSKSPDTIEPRTENDAVRERANSVDASEAYSPPFNISELLTPVLPTKQVINSLENQSVQVTPPLPEKPPEGREQEGQGFSDYQSRDSYKSKLPSLLFNLKDVRKRVKSTYSPLPLLKNLDEKIKGRDYASQESVSNGILNLLEESPQDMFAKDNPQLFPSLPYVNSEEESKKYINGQCMDNYLPLSSPQILTEPPFYINGEGPEQNNSKAEDLVRDPKGSKMIPGLGHQLNEPNFKKGQHLPSLKLYGTDATDGKENQLSNHYPENVMPRSISQENQQEKEAGNQKANLSQKISPGPLSPEEEDVFYSDSQSDFFPSLKNKAKISTSSSDQSFASFEDLQSPRETWQKARFPESQREERQSGPGERQKREKKENTEEEEELRYSALVNGETIVEEEDEESLMQRERKSTSGDIPMMGPREEFNCKGAWSDRNAAVLLPHKEDLQLSPSSSSHKHIVFTIKDNTFKSSPVIKPILLPLLRTQSSEETSNSGKKETARAMAEQAEMENHVYQEARDTLNRQQSGQASGSNVEPSEARKGAFGTTNHSRQISPGVGRFLPGTGVIPSEDEGDLPGDLLMKDGASRKVPKCTVGSHQKSKTREKEKVKPAIVLSSVASEEDLSPNQALTHLVEQTEGFKSHLLSAPRAGSLVRHISPEEMMSSPTASSLVGRSMYSPATSTILEECFDDRDTLLGNFPCPTVTSPLSGIDTHLTGPVPEAKSSTKMRRREDGGRLLRWNMGCNPLDPYSEGLIDSSQRGLLSEHSANSTSPCEKSPSSGHVERSAGKPPAVPPKTEKALRRAKKLANKRRKPGPQQEKHTGVQEEKPRADEPAMVWERPLSPSEISLVTFPTVHPLPPSTHHHSISTLSEPIQRRQRIIQSATPVPSHPATQRKLLQDPHSGEYFVFDLPVQVQIKTFYDPETGKYIKVSIPSSEKDSLDPASPEDFNSPHVVYPGFQPLSVTSLAPRRSASELSAPIFRQNVQAMELTEKRYPSPGDSRHLGSSGDVVQSHPTDETPQSSETTTREAPSLDIISTDNLEDFAAEGIS